MIFHHRPTISARLPPLIPEPRDKASRLRQDTRPSLISRILFHDPYELIRCAFFIKKKKSAPYGPCFPAWFNSFAEVRKPNTSGGLRKGNFISHNGPSCYSIREATEMSSSYALATACSVSHHRLNIRPSASHNTCTKQRTPAPPDIDRTSRGVGIRNDQPARSIPTNNECIVQVGKRHHCRTKGHAHVIVV